MGILTGLTAAAADEGKKAQVKSAAASGGDEKADQWIALLQGLIDLRTAENPAGGHDWCPAGRWHGG